MQSWHAHRGLLAWQCQQVSTSSAHKHMAEKAAVSGKSGGIDKGIAAAGSMAKRQGRGLLPLQAQLRLMDHL